MTYNTILLRFAKHKEELEERAAIMQYHGGMTKETAEFRAAMRIADKYKLYEQGYLFTKDA